MSLKTCRIKIITFAVFSVVLLSAQRGGALDIAQLKEAQKEALAVYNQGVSYEKGDGVPKDFDSAVSCYRKAAVMGDHNAQYRLGCFYFLGNKSISQDYKTAADYFLLAAKQCNPDAQDKIGACYILGRGVSKDEVEGYKWLYLASMNGCQNAIAMRKRMEQTISSSKIDEGKSRAVAFLKCLQTQYGLQ